MEAVKQPTEEKEFVVVPREVFQEMMGIIESLPYNKVKGVIDLIARNANLIKAAVEDKPTEAVMDQKQ